MPSHDLFHWNLLAHYWLPVDDYFWITLIDLPYEGRCGSDCVPYARRFHDSLFVVRIGMEVAPMSDFTTLRAAILEDANGIMVDRTDLAKLLAEVDALRAGAPKKKAAPVVIQYDAMPWLPLDHWNAFLDMRKKIKKPATEYAQTLLLKKLAAFHANNFDIAMILCQSIMNSWQDLYMPKDQNGVRHLGLAAGPAARTSLIDAAIAKRRDGGDSFPGETIDV